MSPDIPVCLARAHIYREYILRVVGKNDQRDWHETWKASSNFEDVQRELERLHALKTGENTATSESHSEFAMPLLSQVSYVTHRVFQQYWRTPSYIQNKYLLVILSALFIGFTFYKQNSTQTGLQNLIFGVFMLAATFATITQQVGPSKPPEILIASVERRDFPDCQCPPRLCSGSCHPNIRPDYAPVCNTTIPV